MKRTLLIIAIAVSAIGCTDSGGSTRILDSQGYTDVQIHGYSWFGCGSDDTFATKFTAKTPTGKPVSGVVCSDWFKKSTVRFD